MDYTAILSRKSKTNPTEPPPEPVMQPPWKCRLFNCVINAFILIDNAPSGVEFLWSYGINKA